MNQPLTLHTGFAAPILRDNIDTDQIIPSREMKTVSKLGLGDALFAGQRYVKDRDEDPSFILNKPPFNKATIILSGENFGCGSSREHAVWALKDFGIRAVIAESFGDIFYKNCIVNGIAAIILPKEIIKSLGQKVTLNLPEQTVDGQHFQIAENDKRMLVEGLDAIALTEKFAEEISNYLKQDKSNRPWVYP
ncbi:3-isopropylmalate dehydratase small subunit [Litorimonas haliclonae]|uniref:3-isopropylmalate dehydratase small subunit n=1 Tax=Litorimonas haliclonae TaxID=2081977 RepID=UPI0039F06B48